MVVDWVVHSSTEPTLLDQHHILCAHVAYMQHFSTFFSQHTDLYGLL